eukprot:6825062-Pyramimonas_sp.AAC.1
MNYGAGVDGPPLALGERTRRIASGARCPGGPPSSWIVPHFRGPIFEYLLIARWAQPVYHRAQGSRRRAACLAET